jgi:hypothetical protein
VNAWFRQNRFLGIFLIAFAVAVIGSLYFLLTARSGFHDAKAQFDSNAAELNRLQRIAPFPTEANLRKMKTQAEDYASELNKLKEELKSRVLPVAPMAPNEFQSRLRQVSTAIAEKARANRVKLPDNFYLGFDEFAAALPDTAAAPLLGQQLAQAELLANILVDARVESITAFRRVAAAQDRAGALATPTATPSATPRRGPAAAAAGPQPIERTTIETAFISSPGAARRVLNQIATAPQQFYIVRTLHVLNEKDKGPTRDGAASAGSAANAPAAAAAAAGAPASALQFIVGNERIETSARVEMVRFTF